MPGPIPITDPGFQRALGKMFKRHLAERIEETYAKMSQPVAWLPKNYTPHPRLYNIPASAFPSIDAFGATPDQLSFPDYSQLAPETATEMEVPCPRCGHRAAPEHIVRMTTKRGYKCKCWNCELTWEHNE